MVILRMFGDLPPDLEVELYRETSGETVRWSGRSSGLIERFQGWAIVGTGAVIALFNISGPASALGLLVDLAEKGRTPDFGGFIAVGVQLLFFGAGIAAALFGWRFIKSASQVVWAVTNRRLVRIVGGGAQPTQSWTRNQILKVDRMNWSDPGKRALVVTVEGRGENDPVLIIMGPVDLEAAESALAALEA